MARSSGNSIPNHPIHQSALVMLGMTMSLMLAFASKCLSQSAKE
jgi:hypothetical protein